MQKNTEKLTIAVDGFSSSGKSTIAKALARKIAYKYIDTGAMYRAITYKIIKEKIDLKDIESIKEMLEATKIDFKIFDSKNEIILDDIKVENKIRGLEVSDKVSEVSVIPEIRKFLVKIQKKIGKKGGIVMDGRDIGTVVFPNADLKFFITASIDTRAKRRYKELKTLKDNNISFKEVKENLEKRDWIDSNRKLSPLKIADDAILINTEKLSREEQLEFVYQKVKDFLNKKRRYK